MIRPFRIGGLAISVGLIACGCAAPAATTDESKPSYQSPSIAPSATWAGRIAFTSERDGNPEIYVAAADGSLVRLTDNPGVDAQASCSADGTRIAFSSERDGNPEIYVMNTDGSEVTRLTEDPSIDGFPAWSPDGSRIAFASDRDGN